MSLGYSGDIRFLGDPNGILPLDRPNQIKLYGNYSFTNGLNLGVNVNLSSRQAADADGGQPDVRQRG